MFLAARLAALQLLREHGVFQLPARRISGKVVGLSGTQHEFWIEHPAECIRIKNFDFSDKAAALITLDDGRQLRFQLIGSGRRTNDGQVIPSVFLDLKDTALAGLSPEELRSRTTLLPDGLCWLSHWKDAELQMQANEGALAIANDLMDSEGEYQVELAGVEQKFRRETLLHLEVKRILSESQRIRVPGVQCYALRIAADGHDIEHSFDFPALMIPLVEVALEKRFGRLIPDVTARTSQEHGGVLLIEVTVTNTIDWQRQVKICEVNVPAIEVDLSRTGGMISRSELRDLIVEGIEFKRWLCHPKAALTQQELTTVADTELQERNWAIQEREQARQLVLATPIESIVSDYLDAIYRYQTLARNGKAQDLNEVASLLKDIPGYAEQLAVHGFDEAKDGGFFGSGLQIISRILSIKNGGGVGYKLDSTMGIMNAIKQARVQNRKYHTIYLIAEAVYRKGDAPEPPAWYRDWVKAIKMSIETGEKMYVRTRRYDQFLSLLFPEMRYGLEKSFGTEDYKPMPLRNENPSPHIRRQSRPGENDPSLWLQGRELEHWKTTNPAAAKNFFGKKNGEEFDE